MSAIGMPGHILALFAPRPALEFVPLPKRRKLNSYSGLADLVEHFETTSPPAVPTFETPKERKKRLKEEKDRRHQTDLKLKIEGYDPHKDPEGVKTQDPSKTLFVGKLSYEANEKKLLTLFEAFGPVHDIRVVTDQNGKPRGYAFVEFERSEDMRLAFREADGKRVEGKRIVLDVERSRTDPNWLPRRLGGGRGPQREGKKKESGASSVLSSSRHSFPGSERDRSREFVPKERDRSPVGSYGPSNRTQAFRDRDFGDRRLSRPPVDSSHDRERPAFHGRSEMGASDRSREFRTEYRDSRRREPEDDRRSHPYRASRPRESVDNGPYKFGNRRK